MIRIGYVAINTELPSSSRTFRLANYSEDRMLQTVGRNLEALQRILIWNIDHNITLFRITSGLVPFGSHPVNSGKWKIAFRSQFEEIGGFIRKNRMRVTMHPGQYTVLNTPDPAIFQRSIMDLQYHCAIMENLGLDWNHKIIIHGGGVYKDKVHATMVLQDKLKILPLPMRHRLILENDEHSYSAEDIHRVCKNCGVPGVFDVFHHQCFPSFGDRSLREIILEFKKTWPLKMRQKIHYSNQQKGKVKGAHSESIDVKEFAKFYESIKDLDLDIMLETKDKQESVLTLREKFPEIQ